jgi:hypothetical protein
MPIVGACHCGAVRVEVPSPPETVTECNCSICRRTAARWAYYSEDDVRVTGHPEGTDGYVWGDKMLRIVRCRTCGCVTHWEPLDRDKTGKRMGVNVRNFEVRDLGTPRVRRFDGAETWTYIDE